MAVYDARPSSFTQLTTTAEWEAFLSGVGAWDGVDPSQGSAMAPSLDTPGRNAVLADGNALIKGQLWRCDAPVSTPIPVASAQNRIDRLVLRYTRGATTAPTVVVPTVIAGTPSGSPAIPPITQTPTGIFDIPISRWTATSAGALTTLVDERQFCRSDVNVYKPATTGRTSNATLTNDPDLIATLVANAVYRVNGYLSYSTGAVAGIGFQFGWTLPAAVTGRWSAFYRVGGDTGTTSNAGPVGATDMQWSELCSSTGGQWAPAATPGDNKTHGVIIAGTLITSATIGQYALKWAQDTSNASALNLNIGSYIGFERMA